MRAIRAGRCRERRYADHMITCSDILQNAPFRSQIFKIFFASGGKGALTPLSIILRTPLVGRLMGTMLQLAGWVARRRRGDKLHAHGCHGIHETRRDATRTGRAVGRPARASLIITSNPLITSMCVSVRSMFQTTQSAAPAAHRALRSPPPVSACQSSVPLIGR